MTEDIIASKTHGRREVVIKPEERTGFYHGGFQRKERILGTLGNREVRLVMKDFGDENESREYIKKWRAIKEAGVPTLPTMRLTGDGKVLMTDLTADGSELFGKGYLLKKTLGGLMGETVKGDSSLDSAFLAIFGDQVQRELIEKKVREYGRLASERGTVLPSDDPFELLIHPDKSWEVICLDLESVEIGQDKEKASERNESFADDFLSALNNVNQRISRRHLGSI